MPPSTSLGGLTKWLEREEWREAFQDVFWLHVGPACDRAGIEFEDIADILGPHAAMTLRGCAFEDFLTRDVDRTDSGDPGRNIVDDYLRRRGWKEPVLGRLYMEGLRHSTMSLYEVSDIVPGKSFLARDLVRGGEPVRVTLYKAEVINHRRLLEPIGDISLRRKPKTATTLCSSARPWQHDSNQTASGKPGAVHHAAVREP
jgi:hypothetical protein